MKYLISCIARLLTFIVAWAVLMFLIFKAVFYIFNKGWINEDWGERLIVSLPFLGLMVFFILLYIFMNPLRNLFTPQEEYHEKYVGTYVEGDETVSTIGGAVLTAIVTAIVAAIVTGVFGVPISTATGQIVSSFFAIVVTGAVCGGIGGWLSSSDERGCIGCLGLMFIPFFIMLDERQLFLRFNDN